MGWSCSKKSGDVLDLWTKACIANSGNSNTWRDKGKEYFFEVSRIEHDDGAITGIVLKHIDDTHCRKVASFRINGDGTIARAPKFLKQAVRTPVPYTPFRRPCDSSCAYHAGGDCTCGAFYPTDSPW